jgi:DNA phosphorothioation-dependent restriction protein DptG
MKKNRQIHFFLERDLYDKLKENSEKEGIYLSQYLRNVLRKWYNKDVVTMDKKVFDDITRYIKQVGEIAKEALGEKS